MLYRLEDFSKTRKRESGMREVKSEVLVKIRPLTLAVPSF